MGDSSLSSSLVQPCNANADSSSSFLLLFSDFHPPSSSGELAGLLSQRKEAKKSQMQSVAAFWEWICILGMDLLCGTLFWCSHFLGVGQSWESRVRQSFFTRCLLIYSATTFTHFGVKLSSLQNSPTMFCHLPLTPGRVSRGLHLEIAGLTLLFTTVAQLF